MSRPTVSAIVPTIGRPTSLTQLLESLAAQSYLPFEVLVADGSSDSTTASVINLPRWQAMGLRLTRIPVSPPNAVSQRKAAIEQSTGEYLLLLDDDVILEPDCIERMILTAMASNDVVAVVADFSNQSWSHPTTAWRWYLRICHGLHDGEWRGKVVGPLLRFGFNPPPKEPTPMEWVGAGNSMIRRKIYDISGGFSDFFLYRCTMNEDVDLGLKVARHGRIMFCPQARLGHFHAPGGRVSPAVAAEDDLYNRFLILRLTVGQRPSRAFGHMLVFYLIETSSSFLGCLRRANFARFFALLLGRTRAFGRILMLLSRGRSG